MISISSMNIPMVDGVGHNEGNCHICNDRMQENREGVEEKYPF